MSRPHHSVLIVERSPRTGESLRRHLQHAHAASYTIRCAHTASEGRSYARELRPDAIVCAHMLPDQSGPDLLAELAAEHGANTFALVLLRDSHDDLLDAPAVAQGAHGSVARGPALAERLDETIRHAIEKADLQRQLAQAQADLAAERARLAVTLASIGDAVIMTDTQGHITFLNGEAERLTGWATAAALGQPIAQVCSCIDEQSRTPYDNVLDLVLRSGQGSLSHRAILVSRTQQEALIDGSCTPIVQPGGALAGVVLVFRDISQQRQTEEQLHQNEERLRLALDAGGMGTWQWTPTQKALELDENCRVLLGLETTLLHDNNEVLSTIHAEDRQKVQDALAYAVANNTTYEEDFRVIHPDRSVHWVRGIGRGTYTEHGVLIHMNGINFDITERKRIEETQRLLNSELEQRVDARTTQLQTALNNMEALYTIARAAIDTTDLNEALQQITDRIAAAMPANRAVILVIDQLSRDIIYQAAGGPGRTHVVGSVSYDELMDGLSGWVIQTGQAALSPKDANDPRESASVQRRRLETRCGGIAVVALRYLEHILGTLTVINLPEERNFSIADIELMEAIASQAAIVLVRTRLYNSLQQTNQLLIDRSNQLAQVNSELARSNAGLQAEITERQLLEDQIQQHAARARALADLAQALAETNRESQPLFETIAHYIASLLGDICIVTMLSDDRQQLFVAALYHPDPEARALLQTIFSSQEYHLHEGLAGRVILSGQAMLIPKIQPEQFRAQTHPAFFQFLDRFSIHSLLVVPLRARSTILGGIGIIRHQSEQPYTADDQSFLQDLADRAGLAIENARLFASAEQARSEAERANHAKSAFLASMSHELRTPLNAIIGFTGTLLMRLPGPLNPDQEKQLTTIQSSARHLLALINDILDLAKIESGKVDIRLAPVVCQEIIATIVGSLRPLAEQRALRLSVAAPDDPIVILSDQRALSQILINLVNNAIKFTDVGEVRIEIEQSHDPALAHTSIRVIDTGIGIAPADQIRLFQEFGRVNSEAVRSREGTGLGLRLSQQLARLIGGRIELQSEYGIGSTFTLVLAHNQVPT